MKEDYHCEIYRDASARNAKAIKTTFARQLKVAKEQWAEKEAAKAAAKEAKEAAARDPAVPSLALEIIAAPRASMDGSVSSPLPTHRASMDGTPPIKDADLVSPESSVESPEPSER